MRLAPICVVSLCLLPMCVGCAMCGSQDDYTYAAFGGRWQRDDPFNGRVGSAFAPAGATPVDAEEAADPQSQQTDTNKPTDDDGSADASNAEEVYGEAMSEADGDQAGGSDSKAVTDADENGNMAEINTPSNSTGVTRRYPRSVLH
jgi:hypothetical protein